jgi:hypothetical protein
MVNPRPPIDLPEPPLELIYLTRHFFAAQAFLKGKEKWFHVADRRRMESALE